MVVSCLLKNRRYSFITPQDKLCTPDAARQVPRRQAADGCGKGRVDARMGQKKQSNPSHMLSDRGILVDGELMSRGESRSAPLAALYYWIEFDDRPVFHRPFSSSPLF